MKLRLLLGIAVVSLAGLGGCAVVPGPYGPQVVPAAPVVVAPVYRAPGYAYPGYYGRPWHGRGYYRY